MQVTGRSGCWEAGSRALLISARIFPEEKVSEHHREGLGGLWLWQLGDFLLLSSHGSYFSLFEPVRARFPLVAHLFISGVPPSNELSILQAPSVTRTSLPSRLLSLPVLPTHRGWREPPTGRSGRGHMTSARGKARSNPAHISRERSGLLRHIKGLCDGDSSFLKC